ncbi:hypothetical protein GQ53DRAFT_692928 [Thozetella sp. PMI_491]|nr:hypothetical protein GQ53DRAFT_692928 [Thozetella sp. PMI_491]
MRGWLLLPTRARPCLRRQWLARRWLSSHAHVEYVSVPCASNGSVTLSLHNVSRQSPSAPLVIYLPPFSAPASGAPASISPGWLSRYPTAVINYRWRSEAESEESLTWPNAIHDTLFGYSWIVEHLAPSNHARRDIYVYGSYLGAGLATSLALTESHSHQAMAVRGLVAYNGIYNWTTFLPDHPIHRTKGQTIFEAFFRTQESQGPMFRFLEDQIPDLFRDPSRLFDTFASPSLFFHNPGMLVPTEFGSSALSSAIDELAGDESPDDSAPPSLLTQIPFKTPRKGYLAFPPRQSTLKIPSTLLLYDATPVSTTPSTTRRRRRKKDVGPGNSFKTQAEELAALMRRSVEKLELKERQKWDDEFHGWEDEPRSRVQNIDIGVEDDAGGIEMGEAGQALAHEWLADRIGLGTASVY